ncbi:hypothetical protein SAMN05421848_0454 [Kushneria avicenniae]|uniref:Uncharacterized protein n=1 Tax=Kushneria avicenniae TaxID=402385 RepID=A0A1I1G833_9GAMM|nr:hypothetical protein [Kushneria avicenniae]SFC07734.1 hypothetical protein SAMN05421848_0454 [Kushneria avicenniae]
MSPSSVLKPALVCVVVTCLSACGTSPEKGDTRAEDTLTVSAVAIDGATARADALEKGQAQCLARGGREVSLINAQVTPPTMAAVDDDPDARSSTDALEAATSEGDAWRATLTLRCR